MQAMSEARRAVPFDSFFACAEGATPRALLQRGVYRSIATSLRGGAWRPTSLVLLKQGLGGATQEPKPGSDDHGRGGGTAHHGGSARVPSPRRSPYRSRSRRAQQLQLAPPQQQLQLSNKL